MTDDNRLMIYAKLMLH